MALSVSDICENTKVSVSPITAAAHANCFVLLATAIDVKDHQKSDLNSR